MPATGLRTGVRLGCAALRQQGGAAPVVHARAPHPARQRGGAVRVRAQTAAAGAAVEFEADSAGVQRLRYRAEGWSFWNWRGHRIHYLATGSGPPVVLVHGFGANAYHWRYQVAALSKTHTVHCLCLLGYGWSSKALVDYSLELWGDLVSDFIRQVVGAPAVVAGNSIGAVTVLSAAYVDPALVRGIVLLNAAGRFDSDATPAPAATQKESGPSAALSELFRRVVSAAIFFSTKFRIAPILKTVYVNHAHVDAELVESIYAPACDPDALEAFFLISGSGGRSKRTLNELLRAGLNAPQGPIPMLLCWGMADPWMKPDKAQRILELYPGAKLVSIEEGSHCPHDDAPAAVNEAMLQWMATLPAAA